MGTQRAVRRSAVVVLLALMVGACGGGEDQETSSGSGPDPSTTVTQPPRSSTSARPPVSTTTTRLTGRTTTTVNAETQRKVNELLEDTRTAVDITNKFWAKHWSEFFTATYTTPKVMGGYFGAQSPLCGGVASRGQDNAFYCLPDDYIAWDWLLMAGQYEKNGIGDAFVYMVIAHEWAHAIQNRLRSSVTLVARELQADCFAGATIAGAVADKTLRLEQGDRGEIFKSLASLADKVEWGNVRDHGSADQRIEYYQVGEKGGVKACLPATR